jgi:hypothetical protein
MAAKKSLLQREFDDCFIFSAATTVEVYSKAKKKAWWFCPRPYSYSSRQRKRTSKDVSRLFG